MSRRLLQTVNLALALLTIFLAGNSLIFGSGSPIYEPGSVPSLPALDSNLRFMGGMGLGLALALIWITPSIEKHTLLFRVVWICALLGGIGRIASAVLVGQPPLPMIAFAVIEVPLVPAMIYWQHRVAVAAADGVSR